MRDAEDTLMIDESLDGGDFVQLRKTKRHVLFATVLVATVLDP